MTLLYYLTTLSILFVYALKKFGILRISYLGALKEKEKTWDLQNDTKIDTNTKLLAIFKELYYITTCFMQRIAGSMKYTQRTFLKN